jgi:hypothetical protein
MRIKPFLSPVGLTHRGASPFVALPRPGRGYRRESIFARLPKAHENQESKVSYEWGRLVKPLLCLLGTKPRKAFCLKALRTKDHHSTLKRKMVIRRNCVALTLT